MPSYSDYTILAPNLWFDFQAPTGSGRAIHVLAVHVCFFGCSCHGSIMWPEMKAWDTERGTQSQTPISKLNSRIKGIRRPRRSGWHIRANNIPIGLTWANLTNTVPHPGGETNLGALCMLPRSRSFNLFCVNMFCCVLYPHFGHKIKIIHQV